MSYMDVVGEEGAEFLTGGGKESFDPAYDNGYYIQPTLLRPVSHLDMRLPRQPIDRNMLMQC